MTTPTRPYRLRYLVEALIRQAETAQEYAHWAQLIDLLSAALPPADVAQAHRLAAQKNSPP